MESAMDGEELPYPIPRKRRSESRAFGHIFRTFRQHPITSEDADVYCRIQTRRTYDSWREHYNDAIVMHARTSCTGVKPAMKNLAVFLKYS